MQLSCLTPSKPADCWTASPATFHTTCKTTKHSL